MSREIYRTYSALLHVHRENPQSVSWEEVEHARARLESSIEQRGDICRVAGMYTLHNASREYQEGMDRVGGELPARPVNYYPARRR
jgi:hypothetical protein